MANEQTSKGAFGKIAAISLFLGAGIAGLAWLGVVPRLDQSRGTEETAALDPNGPVVASDETAQPSIAPVIELSPDPAPEPVTQAAVPAAPTDENSADLASSEVADDTVGEVNLSDEKQEDIDQSESGSIELDVVRVSPDGSSLVAGSGPTDKDILILVGGSEIARAKTDRNGKFVALFDIPQSSSPQNLTLGIEDNNGALVLATSTVLIAPTIVIAEADPVDEGETAIAEAEPAEQGEPVAQSDIAVAEVSPEIQAPEIEIENAQIGIDPVDERPAQVARLDPVEAEPRATITEQPGGDGIASVTREEFEQAELARAATDDEVQLSTSVAGLSDTALQSVDNETQPFTAQTVAPSIVIASDEGLTILQPPARPNVPGADEVDENVVIDTIEYDALGDVALTGRGALDSSVRVYLDDRPVQTVGIRPDGTWAVPLPGIDAGLYRLRIDELDEEGNVTSRIETPFQREELDLAVGASGAITVQSGFTLWAIAEANFGDGNKYVRVYEANRDLIRDPDLIYPGQVFQIPDDSEDG